MDRNQSVNSDTYNTLPIWTKDQVDAVVGVLKNATGAYSGSDSDMRTDATGIVLAMMFSPVGDNHHNANLCPYCNPKE